jgi:hypothetical protein
MSPGRTREVLVTNSGLSAITSRKALNTGKYIHCWTSYSLADTFVSSTIKLISKQLGLDLIT